MGGDERGQFLHAFGLDFTRPSGQGSAHECVADVFLAVAGQRGSGGEEEGLQRRVEEVVPEPSPLRHLVEVSEYQVCRPERPARRVRRPQCPMVVGGIEDQHALLDPFPGQEFGQPRVFSQIVGGDSGQIEIDEAAGHRREGRGGKVRHRHPERFAEDRQRTRGIGPVEFHRHDVAEAAAPEDFVAEPFAERGGPSDSRRAEKCGPG